MEFGFYSVSERANAPVIPLFRRWKSIDAVSRALDSVAFGIFRRVAQGDKIRQLQFAKRHSACASRKAVHE